MNLGKFAAQFVRELAPFSPENVGRRKTNRAVKKILRRTRKGIELSPEEAKFMAENTSTVTLPSGEQVVRTEPTINLRTSTKTGGTASIGTIVLGLVGVFFPEAMDSLTPEQALWIGGAITTLVAWVTARVTKSPAKPGAL